MKTHNIIWGLLIIGGGVMLLLMAMGLGDSIQAVRIIGSVLLAAITVISLVKWRLFFAVFPLALIAYLWRVELGVPDLDPWLLLASAAVLGIGLTIIFHRRNHRIIRSQDSDNEQWQRVEDITSQDDVININSSFGEHTKYIHAENVKKVNISSTFSSVKVYFDQCTPSPEGLTIHVSGNFSGIVLSLPQSWKVENQISTFAAEVNDRGVREGESPCQVFLKGSINFAEVKINRIPS